MKNIFKNNKNFKSLLNQNTKMGMGMNTSLFKKTWLNNKKCDGFFKTCYSTEVKADMNVYVKDEWRKVGFVYPGLRKIFDLEKNNKIEWKPFKPGIDAYWLFRNPDGSAMGLLKYQPGARVPPHWHLGYEMVVVLEGSFTDEHGVYHKGDLNVNPTGSHHHDVYSEQGCTLLISWTNSVEFLKYGK
eukprot:TRINITY_DN5433_c0_g1_i1.p1 TRINITY_DN5433_c0_g1~~TRINITY_DN5433_c0_g1_i1.p1  ORF type:complete len:186 (-),score=46.88 TRINITY_DN5433_c0_g1_i1:39-596(-)